MFSVGTWSLRTLLPISVLTDYSGDNLDILIKNGNLDLQVKKVTNRINIESKNAELNLGFGPMPDPTFNIKTRQGRIIRRSPLSIWKNMRKMPTALPIGRAETGNFINNIYGDII